MANVRDEVLEAFREGRATAEELGLRRYYTSVRRRVWYDGTSAPWTRSARGRGYPVDTETRLTPAPVVTVNSARQETTAGGTRQAGGFLISKITPRGEPDIGIELPDLVQASTDPTSEEVHIIVESRAGTPHHVYEGTQRCLTAGPYSVATAITTANALRSLYATHMSSARIGLNYAAHLFATIPTLDPIATDEASAIALANSLRTAWIAHRIDTTVHPAVDAYAVVAAAATDAQTLLVLLHDLLRVFNLHVASGDVYECVVVSKSAHKSFELRMSVKITRRTP